MPLLKILPSNSSYKGKRSEQQDSFGFSRFDDQNLISHGGILAVVADGMGGFNGGAIASRRAVIAMRTSYQTKLSWESIPDALLRALGQANRAVFELATAIDSEGHCGTTLVAAVVHANSLYWVSVGDSRLYLFRNKKLYCLTDDHVYGSYEQNLAFTPQINSRQEAQSGVLTSWLGLRKLPQICIRHDPMPLKTGDRLLLCTDGLFKTLPESEITKLLINSKHQTAAGALIDVVMQLDKSNQDNATAIVLEIID